MGGMFVVVARMFLLLAIISVGGGGAHEGIAAPRARKQINLGKIVASR